MVEPTKTLEILVAELTIELKHSQEDRKALRTELMRLREILDRCQDNCERSRNGIYGRLNCMEGTVKKREGIEEERHLRDQTKPSWIHATGTFVLAFVGVIEVVAIIWIAHYTTVAMQR